jgi:hypothetical protein
MTYLPNSLGGVPQDFSTSEQSPGNEWVDAKEVFSKTIDLGALPNASVKNVAHGLSFDTVIMARGAAIRTSPSYVALPLPYVDDSPNFAVRITIDGTNIVIDTGTSDRSAYTGHLHILYTKT